jgi:hypothetical protein
MNYQEKYLKYKNKYIHLQKQLGGGRYCNGDLVCKEGFHGVSCGNNERCVKDEPKKIEKPKLTKIEIPDSTTTIGNRQYAFNELTNVKIPNLVTLIDKEAFAHNQLTNIEISDSVLEIGNQAFAYNQLINIIIPNSVQKIGDKAFSYNNNLKTIILPEKFKNDIERICGKNASTITVTYN